MCIMCIMCIMRSSVSNLCYCKEVARLSSVSPTCIAAARASRATLQTHCLCSRQHCLELLPVVPH